MSAAEESSRPPRHVGVYRLDEKIGSGAMGTVYRATHTTLGKEVALKIVHSGDPDGELCQRFLQEGIAASKVRHPNVVEVMDAGREGETAYLAMQLLEGETLGECLQRQGRLPLTYAIDVILPVCAALKAAHEAGVLHRDLKPANIFLTDVGRGEPEPMLLDFGISKILGPVDAALTQNPRYLGTPLYIAPEQADGAPGSTFSDQYSLALSLYECVLGVRPFEKYSSSLIQLLRHVAEGDIKAPRDLDAGIPDELDEVICRALSRDPKDRFPSLRDFGAALLPFASAPRRALWQHSFMDAERTMASANAPVSDSRNSRRVHVAVDDAPLNSQLPETQLPETQLPETRLEAQGGEFISHSALFGESPEDEERFNAEQSAISRRSLPAAAREEPTDPYSQVPSRRGVSESWGAEPRPLPADRNSVGVPIPDSWRAKRERSPVFAWTVSAILGLATVGTATLLVRHEMRSETATPFAVDLTTSPRSASIKLDGKLVGHGRFQAKFEKDGKLHRLRVSQEGYEPLVLVFQDEAPPATITLKKVEEKAVEPHAAKPSSSDSPAPSTDASNVSASSVAPVRAPSPTRVPSARAAGPAPTTKQTSVTASSQETTEAASLSAESSADATTTPQPSTEKTAMSSDADAPPNSGDTTAPAETPPTQTRSIQTGNLDPWRQ